MTLQTYRVSRQIGRWAVMAVLSGAAASAIATLY